MAATSALRRRLSASLGKMCAPHKTGSPFLYAAASRSFVVKASDTNSTTSAAPNVKSAPTLWGLKDDAALLPLTSPETLEEHPKGLLLEKDEVFVRRMARTWEVVASALWAPGSKAEQILEEACGQQLFDRLVALRKAKTGYNSEIKVKEAKIVDYLEFVNVSDGTGSVVRHGFDPALRLMVSFDAGFASFLKHAGTFFNAIMATGNTPTLGHFVKGTRAFVRVKVKMDCVEQVDQDEKPVTHVITVEMPFEPVVWDQVTETTLSKDKQEDSNADAQSAAQPEDSSVEGSTHDAASGTEGEAADGAADVTKGRSKQGKRPSSKAEDTQDELELPPKGVAMGSNGLPVAVAADGRPVGMTSMGLVAPVAGWRIVDINGHQPVTSSDFDFVSAMLSRRGNLFPDAPSSDADSDDDDKGSDEAPPKQAQQTQGDSTRNHDKTAEKR